MLLTDPARLDRDDAAEEQTRILRLPLPFDELRGRVAQDDSVVVEQSFHAGSIGNPLSPDQRITILMHNHLEVAQQSRSFTQQARINQSRNRAHLQIA